MTERNVTINRLGGSRYVIVPKDWLTEEELAQSKIPACMAVHPSCIQIRRPGGRAPVTLADEIERIEGQMLHYLNLAEMHHLAGRYEDERRCNSGRQILSAVRDRLTLVEVL